LRQTGGLPVPPLPLLGWRASRPLVVSAGAASHLPLHAMSPQSKQACGLPAPSLVGGRASWRLRALVPKRSLPEKGVPGSLRRPALRLASGGVGLNLSRLGRTGAGPPRPLASSTSSSGNIFDSCVTSSGRCMSRRFRPLFVLVEPADIRVGRPAAAVTILRSLFPTPFVGLRGVLIFHCLYLASAASLMGGRPWHHQPSAV
jgi:hypothetical protein